MTRTVSSLLTGALLAATTGCGGGSGDRADGFAFGGGPGQGAGAANGAGGNTGTGAAPNGGNGGISVGAGGGGTVPVGGECAAVSQQAENTFAPVDIVWAIDNSGSMTLEAQGVQDSMNQFASGILQNNIDVHVVVISVDGPPMAIIPGLFGVNGVCIPPPLGSGGNCTGGGDSNPPTYLHISDQVDSNNALEKIIQHYPNYRSILRPNAAKYFAVVTDDESSLDAASFTAQMNNIDPGFLTSWRFFGVFCIGGCPTLGACAATGTVYNQLVAQTGGLAGDLCAGQNGFLPVFNQLSQSVVTGAELTCEWSIPPPPAGETFNKGQVNVQYTPGGAVDAEPIFSAGDVAGCGADQGWFYDNPDNPTLVMACPATCDRIRNDVSGRVDVLFGCDTVTIPR